MRYQALLLGAVVSLASCGSSVPNTSPVKSCTDNSQKGSLVVLAASSMANVFADVQHDFLEEHPCITDVTYSYGSSATLATQIVNGSPADLFVSASEATMNTVENAGRALNSHVFAKNVGEIMVSPTSTYLSSITGLSSLTDENNPGVKVAVCVSSAPCGALADSILEKAGMTRRELVDTESPSVEDLVSKINMGELDAGIVYHSDCVFAEQLGASKCISIPSSGNSMNSYFVASLNSRPVTQQFFDYINSPAFAKTLQLKFGFLAP